MSQPSIFHIRCYEKGLRGNTQINFQGRLDCRPFKSEISQISICLGYVKYSIWCARSLHNPQSRFKNKN